MNQINNPSVSFYSEAEIPTEFGDFRFLVYRCSDSTQEHIAIVRGDLKTRRNVLVRVHSECMTSEVFHSLKCDCREQLDLALKRIDAANLGAVLYLRQEGRGIGLGNKIRAYALQQQGLDTVDANRALGFEDDLRRYDVAVDMLADLGVKSVALMTNNPAKVEALKSAGVDIERRVPHEIRPNEFNRNYIDAKVERMGHLNHREPTKAEVAGGLSSSMYQVRSVE